MVENCTGGFDRVHTALKHRFFASKLFSTGYKERCSEQDEGEDSKVESSSEYSIFPVLWEVDHG